MLCSQAFDNWRHIVSFSSTIKTFLDSFNNLLDSLLFDVRPYSPTTSRTMEALEPTPIPSDGNLGDVEMRAATKPKELQEDAEMEDLFGNDEDLEAKDEDDEMNLQG